MIFKRTYQFDQWTKWSRLLPGFIQDFQSHYIYNPNILQANNHTLSQIDFTTSIDPREASRVTKINDFTNRPEEIESYDKICLSEYCWGNVSLVFTIDDTLPDKTLRLIYDSDPGWDDDTKVFSPYVPDKEVVLT